MKIKERHSKILELLTDYQKVTVNELSSMMDVSQVTIRKDLDALSEKGLIKREHGFAKLNSVDDLTSRLAYHYSIKEQIVKKVLDDIQDGQTIMLESGSCCALLAEQIALTKKDVTIITNSAFIADYIRKYNSVNVILLGGNYQKESQVNVGPMISKCLEGIYVDQLFIGTDGFNEVVGFTGNDMMRSEAVVTMSKHAGKVMIVTESKKFDKAGLFQLLPLSSVSCIYTDNNIPVTSENYLNQNNVKVIKA